MEVETLAAEIQTGVQHRNGPPLDSSQSTSWSVSLGRPFFMAFLTVEVWSEMRGEARVTATTKVAQTAGISRTGVTARGRAWSGSCSLHVPRPLIGASSRVRVRRANLILRIHTLRRFACG